MVVLWWFLSFVFFFIFMFLYFYKMCPTVLCYIANTFVHSTQNRYLDFDQVRFRLG